LEKKRILVDTTLLYQPWASRLRRKPQRDLQRVISVDRLAAR